MITSFYLCFTGIVDSLNLRLGLGIFIIVLVALVWIGNIVMMVLACIEHFKLVKEKMLNIKVAMHVKEINESKVIVIDPSNVTIFGKNKP